MTCYPWMKIWLLRGNQPALPLSQSCWSMSWERLRGAMLQWAVGLLMGCVARLAHAIGIFGHPNHHRDSLATQESSMDRKCDQKDKPSTEGTNHVLGLNCLNPDLFSLDPPEQLIERFQDSCEPVKIVETHIQGYISTRNPKEKGEM